MIVVTYPIDLDYSSYESLIYILTNIIKCTQMGDRLWYFTPLRRYGEGGVHLPIFGDYCRRNVKARDLKMHI